MENYLDHINRMYELERERIRRSTSSGVNGTNSEAGAAQAVPASAEYPASNNSDDEKNKGGLLGGIGYVGEKLLSGIVQSIEGIWDFAAGGIADLIGQDHWARKQVKNDWFGDWYDNAGEWFNPSEGWQTAGDVAGGIGTSVLPIATAFIPAAGLGVSAGVASLSGAGSGVRDAYKKSGKLSGEEWGYGALTGATEGVLETATNALGIGSGTFLKQFGKAGGKALAKGANAATKGVKSAALKSVAKTAWEGFAGEAIEEGAATFLSPYYARMTYDPNAESATLQEIAYSAWVGGLAGVVMGEAALGARTVETRAMGGRIVENGTQSNVLGAANFLIEADANDSVGSSHVEELKNICSQLEEHLKTTNGAYDGKAKFLIGKVNLKSVEVLAEKAMESSVIHAGANAEAIAESLNALNYTDENGKAIRYTAEQLKEGLEYDKNGRITRRSARKALKTNAALRELVVRDVAGHLLMDTDAFAEQSMQGRLVRNEQELGDFIYRASDAKKRELGKILGIADWNAVSVDEVNTRIAEFMNNGGDMYYAAREQQMEEFEAKRKARRKKLYSASDYSRKTDGIGRYVIDGNEIGIEKNGDNYTIYDYDNKTLSRILSSDDLHSALSEYDAKRGKKTDSTVEDGNITGMDAYAKKHINGFEKLSPANKAVVRRIIRQGRAKGVKESVLIDYANVAARARIDVLFDKSLLERQINTRDGKTVSFSANAYYDPHNVRIVANPEAQTSDGILIHELDHAIRKSIKGGSVMTRTFEKAIRSVTEEEQKSIIKRYTGKDASLAASVIESVDSEAELTESERKKVRDEINAYYAQTALGEKEIVRHLVAEKPTLKDKILSFFKKASNDYMGSPNLQKQAMKYYKQYRKWFNEFTKQRYGAQMGDAIATVDKGDLAYSFAGVKANTADKLKLSTAEKMLSEGVDSEKVRKETGWFKGYDGKWRFEIDDSDIKIAFNGKYSRDPDIRRYSELTEKVYFDDTATKAEQEELVTLDKKIGKKSLVPDKLGDLIQHPALFAAYPQLQDVDVYFHEGDAETASYHPGFKEIAISKHLRRDVGRFKKKLIHEVQHAVQDIEGLAAGSNPEMFNNTAEKSAYKQYRDTAGEIEARDVSARVDMSEDQRKNTRPDIDREDVIFNDLEAVSYFAKNEYDAETAGIKDQIRNSKEALNEMDVVYSAKVPENVGDKRQAVKWASEELKKYGFRADRQGFGVISFSEDEIDSAMRYLDTNEERAAIAAIYYVLKRGIKIGEHGDHKARKKHTVTFAGPVELNGVRGNMAVVVNMRNNSYYVHRIVLPDGSAFKFESKNADQELQRGVPKGSLANATRSASATIIPDSTEKINPSDEKSAKKSRDEGSRFALTDEAYLAAVESGDMDTVRGMVDEAAKKAGYTVKGYHGSHNSFTVFDEGKSGLYGGIESKIGFWFGATRKGAENWVSETWGTDENNPQVYESWMKIENPKVFTTTETDSEAIKKVDEEIADAEEKYKSLYEELNELGLLARWSVSEYIRTNGKTVPKNSQNVDEKTFLKAQKIADELVSCKVMIESLRAKRGDLIFTDSYEQFKTEIYKLAGKTAEDANVGGLGRRLENGAEVVKKYKESLVSQGYDGIIIKDTRFDANTIGEGKNSVQIVAFHPEQIKSADPITYDDAGKIIPLSKRFSPYSRDIRFSLPDTDSNGNKIDYDAIIEAGVPYAAGQELSVGEIRKIIANNVHSRVYSKGKMLKVVKELPTATYLSGKTLDSIADSLWQSYNSFESIEEADSYIHDVAKYFLTVSMREAKVEKHVAEDAQRRYAVLSSYIRGLSFTKRELEDIEHVKDVKGLRSILSRWGYRTVKASSASRIKTPIDIFITDVIDALPEFSHLSDMHPVDAFLELNDAYEEAKSAVNDKWQSIYDDVSDTDLDAMMHALETDLRNAFKTAGEKSKYKKLLEETVERYKERADYWKAAYDKENGRSRLSNIVAAKARKLRDIKNHKFANITQVENDTLTEVVGKLGRCVINGNVSVKTARSACSDLLALYKSKLFRENFLGYYDENTLGYYNGLIETYLEILSDTSTKRLTIEDYVEDGEKYYNGFTKSDLKMLAEVMSYFIKLYDNYGKVWYNGSLVEAMPLAKEYVAKEHENVRLGLNKGITQTRALGWYSEMFADPAALVRRMDCYSDGFFTDIYEQMRSALIETETAKMRLFSKYDAFLREHKNYLRDASGKNVEFSGYSIPKIKVIDLYCSLKREQARAGLSINGFAYKDTKGDIVRAKGRLDFKNKYTQTAIDEKCIEMLNEIDNLLTAEDRQYIEIIEDVYNSDAKLLKTMRDYARQGFTNSSEGYYYPIRRANIGKNIDTNFKEELDRVSNASFNKDIVEGAQQELIIESADERFRRHVNAVCQYAYLSPVVDSYNTLFNLDTSGNRNKPVSIRTEAQNMWANGENYFRKLVGDVQGITQRSDGDGVLSYVRGGYAIAMLSMNPKVWLTQLSSLISAITVIDDGSVLSGSFVASKEDIENIGRYCPLAELRRYENTAALAQGVVDKRGVSISLGGKIAGAFRKFGEAGMVPIQAMDTFVINRLFGACMRYVAKNQNLTLGTEANKIEAGKMLERVILETQQNSMATERSAAMRSGNEIIRAPTMFSADAMKTIGRVYDAVGEFRVVKKRIRALEDERKKATDPDEILKLDKRIEALQKQRKESNKKVRRSIASLVLVSAYMAGVSALFKLAYNKWDKEREEDETGFETFIRSFSLDVFNNLFGGLPFIRDAVSKLTQGYDIDNYATSSINDLVDSAIDLWNMFGKDATEQDRAKGIRNVVYSLSSITGLPTRNLYNAIYGVVNRISEPTGYKIDEMFYKKNYETDLRKQMAYGDEEMVAFILEMIYGERVGGVLKASTIRKLHRLTEKGYKVLPREVKQNVTIDGEKYTLTESEYRSVKSKYSEYSKDIDELLSHPVYSNLSNEQKMYAVNYVFDAAYDKAMSDVIGKKCGKQTLIAYCVGSEKLAVLRSITKNYTGDTKRKKTISAINAMPGSSNFEKVLMVYAMGYTPADNDVRGISADTAKRMAKNSVQGAQNINETQKEELLKALDLK